MRKQGSITVFAALTMMLVASFLFALLEAAYVQGLNTAAEEVSELCMDSVFAQYQPALWQKYGVLALDGAFGTDEFSIDFVEGAYLEALRENLESEEDGGSFFTLSAGDISCTEYQLLTDAKGTVFLKAAAAAMKEKLPASVLQEKKQQHEQNKQVEEMSEAKDGVESGLAAVEEAKKQQEQAKDDSEATEVIPSSQTPGPNDNPLELVRQLKQTAVLGLVVPDLESVSKNTADFTRSVSKRALKKGTSDDTGSATFTEKILAVEYCGTILNDFVSPALDRQLAYELEYVLCGKDSDRANLEGAVERLLLMREAANFCSISLDAKKKAEAMAVASGLAGASANPPVVRAVQVGIMAAWAFVESLLDVRALLAGDRISFLKNSAEWTTDTADLMQAVSSGARAKHCEHGFSYQDYLKQMLCTKGKKQLSYRMMDLMEKQIQNDGYPNFAMDALITKMTCQSTYQADGRFAPLVFVGSPGEEGYCFYKTKQISYLP